MPVCAFSTEGHYNVCKKSDGAFQICTENGVRI
uniref:Uncharacterized protein n=1 Tax=Anguilla anguilla TaxID=7936 RepID=A0A0E9XDQ2_ANGAN